MIAHSLPPDESHLSLKQEDDSLDLLVRKEKDIQGHAQKSHQHSVLVRRMRLVLPVVALGMVVVLMVWTNREAPLTPVPREQISPQTISQNELINPKFQSEDKSSQPYTITADKAIQNAEDMNTVILDKPVADMTLKSGGWVSLKAVNGQYKQAEGNLSLDGNVEIHHDSGYELHTEKMDIDVSGQTIQSDTPVTGHGPSADISATGLSADGTTDTMIFKGPAKLILRQISPSDPKKENE